MSRKFDFFSQKATIAIFSVKWQQIALNLHPYQCAGIFYMAVLTSKPINLGSLAYKNF